MTLPEFQQQMGRLIKQFGQHSYSEERAKIIWREVRDLSIPWFIQVIDEFIGSNPKAPLLPEFAAKASFERDRVWRLEKAKHEKEAQEFFHSSYGPEDTRSVCQSIFKKITGQTSDADFKKFIDVLNNVASNAERGNHANEENNSKESNKETS